jgi:transposase
VESTKNSGERSVGRASLARRLQRPHQTGSLAPSDAKRGPAPEAGLREELALREVVDEQPDATLRERSERLEARAGVRVGTSAVDRRLARLGRTRKKDLHGHDARLRPRAARSAGVRRGAAELGRQLKVNDPREPERASAADVVGSLVYHAAGFFAPCNPIVYFTRDILRVGPGAKADEPGGVKVPLTDEHLERVFKRLEPRPDRHVRAGASMLLAGSPVGPWNYYGPRGDGPNDVVAHEDRPKRCDSRLLAAWLGHEDACQQNRAAHRPPVPPRSRRRAARLRDAGHTPAPLG